MGNIVVLVAAASLVLGIQLGTRYWRTRRIKRWFQLGMDAYKEKRYEESLAGFRKCVRLAPEWLYARTLMGISLAHTGHAEEALKEIELVEALQPREAETWTLIITFFLVCMPENESRLFEALERLTTLDAAAARTFISQPVFARYSASPRLRALKQQLAVP